MEPWNVLGWAWCVLGWAWGATQGLGSAGGLSFREGLCARCREKLEPEAGREGLTWSESEDEVTGLPECN